LVGSKLECGITIEPHELVELTVPVNGQFDGLITSGGLLDEGIRLFYCQKEMNQVDIDALLSHEGGLRDHGERIKIVLVDFDDVWRKTSDIKVDTSYDRLLVHMACSKLGRENSFLFKSRFHR
jgi:hypothetical protein